LLIIIKHERVRDNKNENIGKRGREKERTTARANIMNWGHDESYIDINIVPIEIQYYQ